MDTSIGYVTVSCAKHKHSCYEIIYYRKGTGSFYFSDKEIPICKGKFIIVPPDIIHSSIYDDEAETVFIKGDFNHIFSFSSPMVVEDNSEKDGEFLVSMVFKNKFSGSEYVDSLTNALLHFLLQNIQTEKNIAVAIKDITNKISDRFYDSNINIGEILTKSGYAEDYIRSQFKIFTGQTPVEFLTRLRVNHACYLIDIYKNSVSLVEIAEKCGYTDYVYFSRRFKHIMGMSPKKYMNG